MCGFVRAYAVEKLLCGDDDDDASWCGRELAHGVHTEEADRCVLGGSRPNDDDDRAA